MPRSSFQKLKIIYIMEYLLKNSDEDHAVTTSQIIAYLKSHDITAERKTIYSDIDALRDFGLDIIQVSEGNNHGYYVARRDFELPELKLLVDSVQSSKFITHKKTLSLIKKIEKLASIHSAQLLNRQVFVKNRIKTMNESIYYTLMQLIVQYHNGSRLWCTCGWKPDELAAKFSGIGAFPGQEASSPEGMMDEKDIIRKMKELGLKVLE